MLRIGDRQLWKQNARIGLLFLILFLPCLSALTMAVNLQEGVGVRFGYFSFYTIILLLPLSFLKSKPYFLFEGIFVILAPLEIIHLKLLGMPISMTFFASVVQTDLNETLETLASFKYEIIATLFVWATYFTLVFKTPNQIIGPKWLRTGFIPAFIILNILLVAYIFNLTSPEESFSRRISYCVHNTIKKYTKIYPVNLFLAYANYQENNRDIKSMEERLKDFRFHTTSSSPTNKEIHILIIGESARSDHFSLNGYKRKTNPNLEQIDNLVSFKNVYSAANYTINAIPLLMSRATPEHAKIALQEKTLPEAFKECGFFSAWIANQSFNDPYIARISQNIDYCHFELTDFDSQNNYDGKLLPYLDSLLTNDKQKIFIVIHTLGSHFRYNYRYPNTFEVFKPSIPESFSYSEVGKDKKNIFINAYDNSIVYTDYVLSEIIKKTQKQQCISTVTYISDHAENLYDDQSEKSMHGGSEPTKYEVHIPLIIWLSDMYMNQHPDTYTTLKKHEDASTSSTILFHTILDLANITYPDEKLNRSIASTLFENDSIRSVLKPNGDIIYLQ